MATSTRRVLRLRYPTRCAVCFRELEPGTGAEWNSDRKVAICLPCTAARPTSARTSLAGGSARAEAARRRAKQTARLQDERERRPVLGRIRQGLFPERDAGKAWEKGAIGEEQLAESLGPLVEAGTVTVLHDRRIPGSRANIDHLVVAPSGVWIVDAKRYAGRIRRDVRGGWLSARAVVTVAGRDRSALVEGMAKQHQAVVDALAETELAGVPIHAAVCFVDGDWGWRFRPFVIGGVLVTWPKALRQRLVVDGHLDATARENVVAALAAALPPAS